MNTNKGKHCCLYRPVTYGPKHHFFGYYDKFPWDITGRYMLAIEADFIDRLPESDDIAVVGIIDLQDNNHFRQLTETYAWNWQQGCMLQWVGPDFNSRVIYNNRVDNKFVSIIMNIDTGEKKTLPIPIYSIQPNGKYAVTLNFARLNHTRKGYGYDGIPDLWFNEMAPKKDGIYLLDLTNGEHKLIISLVQLCKYNYISSMEGGKHWVNHLMFNPDGSKFCFLHRWQLLGGGMYTRLFTANIDGSGLYCLLDSGMFSHFDWRNTSQILGWGRRSGGLNSLRKNKFIERYIMKFMVPMYYYLNFKKGKIREKLIRDSILLLTDKTKDIEIVGSGILDEDGHCSWSPDGKWILTDTYPDKNHYRTLILYNYEKNKRIDIGRFYSLPDKKYGVDANWDTGGMRCDLHPRWSRDGKKLCIDSVHEGSRQMYVLEVDKIINR